MEESTFNHQAFSQPQRQQKRPECGTREEEEVDDREQLELGVEGELVLGADSGEPTVIVDTITIGQRNAYDGEPSHLSKVGHGV